MSKNKQDGGLEAQLGKLRVVKSIHNKVQGNSIYPFISHAEAVAIVEDSSAPNSYGPSHGALSPVTGPASPIPPIGLSRTPTIE